MKKLKAQTIKLLAFTFFVSNAAAVISTKPPDMPIAENFTNSLTHKLLSLKVEDSKLIDDMETPGRWTVTEEKIVQRNIAKISYTKDRSVDGKSSLRFHTPLRDEDFIKWFVQEHGSYNHGVSWVTTGAVLKFEKPQDWSHYNRISLWVYLHPDSSNYSAFNLRLKTADANESFTMPVPLHYFHNLTPGRWNHVIWDIPNYKRDKVTAFQIHQQLIGSQPGQSPTVTYDIDHLELHRVKQDKYEGWQPANGKITFSHVGYLPHHKKIAVAAGLDTNLFEVRTTEGKIAFQAPVKNLKNDQGNFQLLDFSNLQVPGKYYIRAGSAQTRTFPINADIWLDPTYKAINYFYCQRCGFEIPGFRKACHNDWQVIHKGKKKIINGGWYDAGDLSQGTYQSASGAYAMLKLAEKLQTRKIKHALKDRLIEEAIWGAKWILKSRFDDGYRVIFSGAGIYTDDIVGTIDDCIYQAQFSARRNLFAAEIQAVAYRLLKDKNPKFAKKCLEAARQDFNAMINSDTAIAREQKNPQLAHIGIKAGPFLTYSLAVTTAIELLKTTGESRYADIAIKYAEKLIRCQQQEFIEGLPLTGFFYNSPDKKYIIHAAHLSYEEQPLRALNKICKTFPHHKDWINWYAAALLHSQYFLKPGARYSAPYCMLPNSVYQKSRILQIKEPDTTKQMLKQLHQGQKFTDEYYLRRFPIWTSKGAHGNTSVQLTQNLALLATSQLRNDLAGAQLASTQIKWVFGRNPFSQTLMYGAGYDYPQLFAQSTGNIVGSLPVGVDCMKNDQPYFYPTNYHTYKEIWTVPVAKFLANMAYLSTPALITGSTTSPHPNTILFRHHTTEKTTSAHVTPDGSFRALLPSGRYDIQYEDAKISATFLEGAEYHLKLDPENYIDFTDHSITKEPGSIQINATTRGKGSHQLDMRFFNGKTESPRKSLNLKKNTTQTITWTIKIHNNKIPWVAVIIPDKDLNRRYEITAAP